MAPPPVPRAKALASAASAVLLSVPPASVTAPVPILVGAATDRVPAEIVVLHAEALLLVPDRVRTPAPALVRLPVPPIVPEKVVSVDWLTVSALAPSVTVPAPVSAPIVPVAEARVRRPATDPALVPASAVPPELFSASPPVPPPADTVVAPV